MIPKLIVEQKITAFANKYAVYSTDANGQKADMIAFAQQKRLAFKEKVTFYTDDSKTTEAFNFRAEKVMDIHGRFFVEDPNGTKIGAFKKEFAASILNSTWNILDLNDQPVINISESSSALAALRRFGGMIPIFGEIIDIVTMFLKYHFVFRDVATGKTVGAYEKTKLFRDHYALSISDEGFQKVDWRTLAAMAVALDALQAR